MQDQFQISRVDFGNFQLEYDLVPSSCFPNLKRIDEKYVALLRFITPGASVLAVLTMGQLEFWFECLELSAAHGGAYMKILPIMSGVREDGNLYAKTYNNKLIFRSGDMIISINPADRLKEFARHINEIWHELDALEETW